ncbi:MAG: hypothetical protein PHG49_01030 [Candidatus Pacebacteria bacterium]|nr:hypothetical protein [Candidatus Paceibacterota bacterium]
MHFFSSLMGDTRWYMAEDKCPSLFLELKALVYRHSEVQNMSETNYIPLNFKRVIFAKTHTSCYTLLRKTLTRFSL